MYQRSCHLPWACVACGCGGAAHDSASRPGKRRGVVLELHGPDGPLYVRGELRDLTALVSSNDGSDSIVLLEEFRASFLGLATAVEDCAGGGNDCAFASAILCQRCANDTGLNIHDDVDSKALKRTSLRLASLFEALGGPFDHFAERKPDAPKVFELASDKTMDLKHSYFIYARKACVDALSFALHKDDFSLVFSLVSTGRCPTKGFRERYEKAYAAFFAVEPENSLSDGSLARVRTLCDGDVDVRFLEDVVRCGGFQEWLAQVRHGFARLGALCRRHADRADAEAPEIFFCGLSLSSQPAADPSALYNVLALGNADVICRVLNFAVDAHSTRALVA